MSPAPHVSFYRNGSSISLSKRGKLSRRRERTHEVHPPPEKKPFMSGKTVVLTGSTGAIGGAVAAGLASSKQVSTLALVVRDAAKGERIAAPLRSSSLKVDVVVADLARPASVAECAAHLRDTYGTIHALINNAAIVPPTREEVDGLECQFAVNVVAYLVLMRGLLPAMPKGGRVVCVASDFAGGLDLGDLQTSKKPYDVRAVYRTTKQANRMIAAEAAAEGRGFSESGVSVVSCHPGVVTSSLLRNLGFGSGFDTAESGAALPLQLAIGPHEPPTGTYWGAGASAGCLCSFGKDVNGRVALWRACEEMAAARGC